MSGLQKGPAERGHVEKVSKSVKKFFDTFRQFSRTAKNRQKSSKSVEKFFDTFRQFSRGAKFFPPFLGASDLLQFLARRAGRLLYHWSGTSPPLTEVSLGPFGPELPKKSRKCLHGPPALEPQKVSKRSRGTVRRDSLDTFRRLSGEVSRDFLETFRDSGA